MANNQITALTPSKGTLSELRAQHLFSGPSLFGHCPGFWRVLLSVGGKESQGVARRAEPASTSHFFSATCHLFSLHPCLCPQIHVSLQNHSTQSPLVTTFRRYHQISVNSSLDWQSPPKRPWTRALCSTCSSWWVIITILETSALLLGNEFMKTTEHGVVVEHRYNYKYT